MSEQSNLTDRDSRLMRKSRRHEYCLACNAQAAIDGKGSQLVVAARVGNCASDSIELAANVESIPATLGHREKVPADSGYTDGAEVVTLAERGIYALMWVSAEDRRRPNDFVPLRPTKSARPLKAPWCYEWPRARRQDCARPVSPRQAGRRTRVRHRQVVLGFTRLSVRGLDKGDGEWRLAKLAYNCKRSHNLRKAA